MDISTGAVLLALGLTTIAGLSTGIGGAIAISSKKQNTKALSFSLGLSAGVMVYISFMDLLPEAVAALTLVFSPLKGQIFSIAAFFAGILLIAVIDFLIPEEENIHENHPFEQLEHMDMKVKDGRMKRAGVMLALAIGIHNFPEGLATFASALDEIGIALPIVVAIAIHNIPEGIAVAAPIYHSTGSRSRAFWISFLSGMAEPVGAMVGALFLLPFWNDTISSLILAFVGGIMVYISFDELLPSSEKYGHHHYSIAGVIAGMLIMAFGILLM